MKNIRFFLSEKFQFLDVNFSMYLNSRNIMYCDIFKHILMNIYFTNNVLKINLFLY